MKTVLTLLTVTIVVASCQKNEVAVEEVELTGCDCKGPAQYIVKDRLAIHYKKVLNLLNPDDLSYVSLSTLYCNPEFAGSKVQEQDTVYVSGLIRFPCTYLGDEQSAPRFETTDIRKKR